MNTTKRITGSMMLAAALMAGAAVSANAQYGQGPQRYDQGPQRYEQGPGGGWDAPPAEFAAARQRGFRDGVDGARKDFENHRPPNVDNRDEFRNPGFIPRPDRRDYKFGFRRGYEVAVQHIYGGERHDRRDRY